MESKKPAIHTDDASGIRKVATAYDGNRSIELRPLPGTAEGTFPIPAQLIPALEELIDRRIDAYLARRLASGGVIRHA